MIETIYSNENGETGRTGRVQPTFKMPKNIRQVGKSDTSRKIYVEDYVMTFIKQLTGEDYSRCKVAVLVGQYIKTDNCRNIFISGAIEVEGIDTTNEIVFSNDAWTAIYENIKKYFVEAEIVGWFLGGPGYLLEDRDKIQKAHIDNFAGQDKTLLTFDNMEKEESFLIYENNRLRKQEGYYIYYEKNEDMQTYMIDHRKSEAKEPEDEDDHRVVKEIRTVIQNKKPAAEESKSIPRLVFASGALLAVIILVVAAAILNNYDQMKTMQTALDSLAKNLSQVESFLLNEDDDQSSLTDQLSGANSQDINGDETSNGSLDVEVIPGQVNPIEDETADTSDDSKEQAGTDTNTGAGQEDQVQASNETQEDQVVQKEVTYYTVVAGDTLAGISLKLYNSVNYMAKIKELNNIVNEDYIYIGQKLIVP